MSDASPDNGTLDPPPGTERTITLAELLRGGRPMTVLERLEQHALGAEEMTNTEIQAAKIFLDKTVPTLKATEHTGTVTHVNYDTAVLGLLNERSTEAGDAASSSVTVN